MNKSIAVTMITAAIARVGTAVVLISVGSAAVLAADLPARAYTKAPMVDVVSGWTGLYAGVNLGYGVTRSPATNSLDLIPGGTFDSNSADLAAGGVIGGGQIGYNWQFAPAWLLGVEADIQGTNQRATSLTTIPAFAGAGAFHAIESRLNYFGTIRGRLGWMANPSTVLYATGGFAWGETELSLTHFISGGANTPVVSKNVNTGWSVGGGVETRLWGNWTAKAEYLYLNLHGNSVGTNEGGDETTLAYTGTVELRDHIVRAGVNYRF